MSSSINKIKLIAIILYAIVDLTNYKFLARNYELELYYHLINNCLLTKEIDICHEALVNLELLQDKAASKENYPCQTLLLGLQSDLIMRIYKLEVRNKANSILEEVKQSCSQF